MSWTLDQSGTQTATINTEHTLGSAATTNATYILKVQTKNMANGDVLELRAYTKVLSGDTTNTMIYSATYANLQGDGAASGSSASGDVIKMSVAIPSDISITFTLKQTAGTGRSYDWVILRV